MSWLVASGGHSVRASALASVLPMNSLVAQTVKSLPAVWETQV